jgi:serine/threonine protein kinase
MAQLEGVSIRYSAPEQYEIDDKHKLKPNMKTDIWAYGCILL